MSLIGAFEVEVGTPITWKGSGGTYALTSASITSGNGRQGAKGDLGADRAPLMVMTINWAAGSAVTNGNTADYYWAASSSATAGTDNPGGLSGTDATFNTTPSEYSKQLDFIGSLNCSNNAGTGVQTQKFIFAPKQRYGMPVIVNSSGQTMSATESNFSITIEPYVPVMNTTV